jgi:hypothetical protein
VIAKFKSGWKEATSDLTINHDLENIPLEIKTDGTVSGNQRILIYFKDSGGSSAGGIIIKISPSNREVYKYNLHTCRSTSDNFQNTPPSEDIKIWRIAKHTGPRIEVHCNDNHVLDLVVKDSVCTSQNWKGWNKKTSRITFDGTMDTAPYFYRPYRGELPNTIAI